MQIHVVDYKLDHSNKWYSSEMETGQVDRHRSGRPAGRVTGWVEILRPTGQAG